MGIEVFVDPLSDGSSEDVGLDTTCRGFSAEGFQGSALYGDLLGLLIDQDVDIAIKLRCYCLYFNPDSGTLRCYAENID